MTEQHVGLPADFRGFPEASVLQPVTCVSHEVIDRLNSSL